jgi:tetratricopeptide (TPR) repeat protein
VKRYRAKVSVMAAMAAGRRRVDAGDFKGAIRRFDEAVRLDAQCAQAYLYRAGLKLLVKDDAGALADFHAISKLDHSHLPAYRDLTTLSAEEFPALIPAAERALKRAPDCAWAHVFHAFSLRSLMRYEDAIKDLDRAVACEPNSAALYAMRSRVKLTNRQQFYDGVRDMEKAVALAPDWGWLNCWLGEALRHKGDHRRALKALDKGLALDPAYLRGWAWRGGVLVALGRFKDAISSLTRSLAFDPIYHYDFEYTADQKSWALNQRMLARRGLGDIPGALKDLNEAHRYGPRYAWVFNPAGEPKLYERGLSELERAPKLAWALAWRGWTLEQWGRHEDAISELSKALSLNPRLAWPLAWRGKAMLSLGDPGKASQDLDRALKFDPAYAQAWGWRGEARRLLGRLAPAISDFTKAIRLDHRAAWAFAGRGECRQKQGRLGEALHDLDRALAICPDYAEALAWRAETRRAAGNLKGALADADAALKLKPGLVLVYVTRALVKQALHDYQGQLADFRRAAKLDPAILEAAR